MMTFPVRIKLAQTCCAALWLLLSVGGCSSQATPPIAAPRTVTTVQEPTPAQTRTHAPVTAQRSDFEVVRSFPHDRNAFTQGLLWHDGALYESTGREYFSSLRKVELETGKVLHIRRLPNEVFAEGLARVGERLIQLSWKNGRAFVYDLKTLEPLAEWNYAGEGWGLTNEGKDLIMSDGSDVLVWRDAQTFAEKKRLTVTFNGKPLRELNELEWINGEIWANVWRTDTIVRIDPKTGIVKSYLDCSNLLPRRARAGNEDVLNGIAYDDATKRIFVTGKLWPRLFEIKIKE